MQSRRLSGASSPGDGPGPGHQEVGTHGFDGEARGPARPACGRSQSPRSTTVLHRGAWAPGRAFELIDQPRLHQGTRQPSSPSQKDIVQTAPPAELLEEVFHPPLRRRPADHLDPVKVRHPVRLPPGGEGRRGKSHRERPAGWRANPFRASTTTRSALNDNPGGGFLRASMTREVCIADQGRIRGTAHRPGQERLDLPLQDIVSRKADGVVVSFCLQELVEFRLGESGVGSKAAGKPRSRYRATTGPKTSLQSLALWTCPP